jgi:twitching motility protein PilI
MYQIKPYIKLQLDRKTQALLPTEQIEEVFTLEKEKLTPMPHQPPWLLGLINQRSRIFWVMDLANFFGLTPLENPENTTYHLAILRLGEQAVALGLEKVQGMMRIPPEQLQPALGLVPKNLEPYLSGCLVQKENLFLVPIPSPN